MKTALSGIKVLDFSHALAGPYCTLLLSDYGATVYKVESPGGGDMARGWGPPFSGDQSSYFLGLNRGKESVAVDLKSSEGVELCLRMTEKVDVLIENLRPGTLDRLGLGYSQVRDRNQEIIYCSISGYGQNGPRREEPAMDLILQASSGLMSITGTQDGQEVRCGLSVADITTGLFALIAVLMALRAREHSGAGQFVDVSMFDSMISAMTSNFMNYIGSDIVPRPLGTSFANIVPYRTFAAQDREIAIAVASEKLWESFCRAIRRPELINHPDYATNALRVKNRNILEPLLSGIFCQDIADNWIQKLSAASVPVSLVRRIDEVVGDAHSVARNMFPDMSHSGGQSKVTGPPIKFSETPGRVSTSAPLLGQHTRKVLSNLLNLNAQTLDQLEETKAILQNKHTG